MKKLLFLFFALAFVTSSCSKIPDKSIFTELTTEELADAIKSDTSFGSFYELTESYANTMSDVNKAKFNDVTYRRLFKYVTFINDSTYWKPLREEWEKDWNAKYGIYEQKFDSTMSYWEKYKEDNSLSKYVKIELDKINTVYYTYLNEVSDVQLGFKLTPINDTIDQIVFAYGYHSKIEGESAKYDKKNCRLTTPFSTPVVKYWDVSYSERKIFAGYKDAASFLRDYNLHIEITDIRKNGVNISVNDLAIPEIVKTCMDYKIEYGYIFESTREDLIKELINKNYISKWDFYSKEADAILKDKDELCFNFVEFINKQEQKEK